MLVGSGHETNIFVLSAKFFAVAPYVELSLPSSLLLAELLHVRLR